MAQGGVHAVNSNKRKTGGAYRLKRRSISLHAKAGKDRSKSRKRVKK
jgi:hypothetical protein